MKKVFAILHEPASYTVDRNNAVYDKLGVRYCYMHSSSLAKSESPEIIDSLSGLSSPQLWKRLRDILINNDIIVMNGYTGKVFTFLYILNLYYRRPIGLDSDTQLNIPGNLIKRLIKRLYLSTIFADSKIFGLPGGTKTHHQLFRHYGMSENRICLMPMVVNNNRFAITGARTQAKFRFLYVGRIVAVKNLHIMLNAFVKGFKNNPNVELRIVGDGDLLGKLYTQYREYDNITFAGAKFGAELEHEYKLASSFVLPSSYEPWGLVVNEAMAAGLPVIASDQVGAAWDLIDGHNTGFIFKHDDSEDLKDKMILLAKDKELYRTFSKNASRRVNDEWNYNFYNRCLLNFISRASKAE